MALKVTKDEYDEFLKDYAWELLQNPEYRLGQAFLRFFTWVDIQYHNDGDNGSREALRLWGECDTAKSQAMIDKWLE